MLLTGKPSGLSLPKIKTIGFRAGKFVKAEAVISVLGGCGMIRTGEPIRDLKSRPILRKCINRAHRAAEVERLCPASAVDSLA